jgi:hypothetical protein
MCPNDPTLVAAVVVHPRGNAGKLQHPARSYANRAESMRHLEARNNVSPVAPSPTEGQAALHGGGGSVRSIQERRWNGLVPRVVALGAEASSAVEVNMNDDGVVAAALGTPDGVRSPLGI